MEDYLERIDKIVVDDIIPLEEDFLMHGFLNVLPKLNQCRDKVKKVGLWTPYLSEKYGGLGLSLLEFAKVSEILGKSLLGHYCFNSQAPDIANIELLKHHASDDYVINGNKWFTSSADGASICVVMAVTDPDAENKYSRASMFVVPTDNPGFELVRNIPVMGDEGEN